MASYRLEPVGLCVEGILDTPEVNDFDRHCRLLLESSEKLVRLDLSGVSFISSACAGVILSIRSEVDEQGMKFELVSSMEVKKVLDLIGFTDLSKE